MDDRESKKIALEKAVRDYYTSLSEEELEEQAKWGEFAWAEFAKLETRSRRRRRCR